MITVVVNVDATAVAGSAIVNQAMARGVYPSGTVVSEVGVGTEGPELSCLPVVAGTVCDLSALVEVPVSQPHVESLPPVPTPDVQTVQLPRTGASHVKDMLLVAFGSMLVGGAMLLGRRRLGAR
jgi:LPXTG-motif cell wall-anchored protein